MTVMIMIEAGNLVRSHISFLLDAITVRQYISKSAYLMVPNGSGLHGYVTFNVSILFQNVTRLAYFNKVSSYTHLGTYAMTSLNPPTRP